MTSKAKHLSIAKRAIAAGTASFRSAANHIAAAVKAGATQAEAAAKVGKSQSWVNRLLKWRENGFKEDSPFADDHTRAIISAANNPATQTKTIRTVIPAYQLSVPTETKTSQRKCIILSGTTATSMFFEHRLWPRSAIGATIKRLKKSSEKQNAVGQNR